MHHGFWIAMVAVLLVPLSASAADDETTRALATITAVGSEGKGNPDAGPAWKTLVAKGLPALFPTLVAIDDRNVTAANWLRTAVDAIAEGEKTAGRKLPVEKLESFATNAKFAPSARRLAFELLDEQDPSAKSRLLPGFLNDKSAELRRDAIANELAALERSARPTIKADLEKLFAASRDQDQVELLAKKLKANGGKPDVTEHFGFITHASLIGPFDAPESKGFSLTYPPETAKDAIGSFKGKADTELKWKPFSTSDLYGAFDLNKLLGKHKNAVAYALAVVVAEKEMPCEIRVGSPTSVKIFLNQKELFGRDEYHHGDPLDAHAGKGTLKKGENVIVLKVCQNDQKEPWAQAWQFQVRV
ncbi:MAG TPA: hypothetical protein VLM40_14035, partial [Gemmata sp.]|nr:hypothetical protein [Gemmata sp.]